MSRPQPDCASRRRRASGMIAAAGVVLAATLLGGCDVMQVATPQPSPSAAPAADQTLSPVAAAIPRLRVDIDGRALMLDGYDPAWPSTFAADRDLVLRLAPHLQLGRGRTYDVAMSYQAIDPVLGWLPPDFGLVGGSEPVRTADGFVTDRPTSAFVRDDGLPDLEAGLFGVKVATGSGTRIYAYPVWLDEPDTFPADAFAGFRLGIADEDGATASRTFIAHVQDDLRRGGAPAPALYTTRADLDAAYDAGRLDAFISIPKGWSDRPTTRNGFESGSRDAATGNGATDTGDSYTLASLIVRALGPAGLVINRGY